MGRIITVTWKGEVAQRESSILMKGGQGLCQQQQKSFKVFQHRYNLIIFVFCKVYIGYNTGRTFLFVVVVFVFVYEEGTGLGVYRFTF